MKRIKIVKKSQLSNDQLKYIDQRLNESVHKDDSGPPNVWNTYKQYLYAFVLVDHETPIGLAEASGRPESSPGWWIDSKYRNQGYGYELVDVLAEYLITDGVEKIGQISIQGNFHEYSCKLVSRLKMNFSLLVKKNN